MLNGQNHQAFMPDSHYNLLDTVLGHDSEDKFFPGIVSNHSLVLFLPVSNSLIVKWAEVFVKVQVLLGKSAV